MLSLLATPSYRVSLIFLLLLLSGAHGNQSSRTATPPPASRAQQTLFTPLQQQWLSQIGSLRAGISRTMARPFERYELGDDRGLGIDILKLMAERLGTDISIQLYDNRDDLIAALERGEIHLTVSEAYSEFLPRSPNLSSAYVTLYPQWILGKHYRWNNETNNLRVAVPRQSLRAKYVEHYFPKSHLVWANGEQEAVDLVGSGQADAYISNTHNIAGEINRSNYAEALRIGPELSTPPFSFHFRVSPTAPLLTGILNTAYADLNEYDRTRLTSRWQGTSVQKEVQPLNLRPGEQRLLDQYAGFRVTLDLNAFPLSRLETQGEMVGMALDISRELFGKLGKPIRFFPAETLEQALKRLADNETDLLLFRLPRGEAPPDTAISTNLARYPIIVVMQEDSPTLPSISALGGKRVAGKTKAPWFLSIQQQSAGIVPVHRPDAKSAMDDLVDGKVDAVLGNQAILESLMRGEYSGKTKIAATTQESEDLVFIARQKDIALVDILNRALASIPSNEKERLRNKWLGSAFYYSAGINWRKWAPILASPLLGLSIVIIVLSVSRHRLRKEVEQRKASEQRLQDISRNLPAVIYKLRKRKDGKIDIPLVLGNTEQLLGIARRHFADDPRALLERLKGLNPKIVARTLNRSAKYLEPLWHEQAITDDHGQQRWIATYIIPRRLANGDVHWSGYWIDTTVQHQQAQALSDAKEQAERSTRAIRSFLATISHEVRTPMSAIIGALELIHIGNLDHRQRHLLSSVTEASGSLMQILDDVLDFFKLDEHKMDIHPKPTDLRHLVDNILGTLAPRVHSRGLTLRLYLDPLLADQHLLDPLRIRQVLFNLINNASKFTHEGEISVSVTVEQDSADQQIVSFTVSDTGVGIELEKQKLLFTPFEQASSDLDRQPGGTGLGLAISQRLVNLMNGDIRLTSVPNAGTEVVVTVPLFIIYREPKRRPLKGISVSIDIPNSNLFHSLSALLQYYGARVVTEQPSLVLLAPDSPNPSRIPCIQLIDTVKDSGLPWEGKLGVNPIRMDELLHAILLRLGLISEAPSREGKAPSLPPALQNCRVLLAEDNELMGDILKQQLELLGLRVEWVRDGLEALERFRLSGHDYDLLLTDIHMPNMDGRTLASTVRQSQRRLGSPNLTIVGMTANITAIDEEANDTPYMDEVIIKPVHLQALRNGLIRWLPADKTAKRAPQQAIALPDLAALFGDAAVGRGILADLIATARAEADELEQALGEQQPSHQIGHRLHRLLSGLALLGDTPPMREGQHLDRAWQNGEPVSLAGVAHFIDSLRVYLDALQDQSD